MNIIETERLILRTWIEDDIDAYYHINQDPKVIEFLRGTMTLEEVKNFVQRANEYQNKYGYALWATCLRKDKSLIGYIGLQYIDFNLPFTPAVEIGWRLGSEYWGKGYATEGAKAALEFGFNKCNISEIIAFTVPANIRSQKIMEKIGLIRKPEYDFAHPHLPLDHPLSQHIFYSIKH